MNTFKATKDGLFLDDLKIQACHSYTVEGGSEGEPPMVSLKIACERVDIIGETGY